MAQAAQLMPIPLYRLRLVGLVALVALEEPHKTVALAVLVVQRRQLATPL